MGTFNPNGYDSEQIAVALKRGYESNDKFSEVNAQFATAWNAIYGMQADITDLKELSTLEDKLLTPTAWDSNILSIAQEDISIDGGSGDTARLSTDGTIHITKSSSRTMTVDFGRVYLPRMIGSTVSYNFGVFGIPEEDANDIICSIYVNDKLCVTTKENEGDVWLIPGIDVFNAAFRIELSAETTVTDLVLKPFIRSTNADPWTESTWEPFFPSLTWLASLAKTNNDNKILFDGSRNALYLDPENLTTSNASAQLTNGKLEITKSGNSSATVTISGISLPAGTYIFDNIGDDAMETKLMNGDTVIATSPGRFAFGSDITGLSLVIEIASDAEFSGILTLPYVTTIQTGLSKYSWEPFYPSLMDIYRGMS